MYLFSCERRLRASPRLYAYVIRFRNWSRTERTGQLSTYKRINKLTYFLNAVKDVSEDPLQVLSIEWRLLIKKLKTFWLNGIIDWLYKIDRGDDETGPKNNIFFVV